MASTGRREIWRGRTRGPFEQNAIKHDQNNKIANSKSKTKVNEDCKQTRVGNFMNVVDIPSYLL